MSGNCENVVELVGNLFDAVMLAFARCILLIVALGDDDCEVWFPRDVDRSVRLGDAIPAESFAVGANALRWFVNYEYLRNADHGWTGADEEPKWRHSDIKNVDYRYVQDFFRHIKEATE